MRKVRFLFILLAAVVVLATSGGAANAVNQLLNGDLDNKPGGGGGAVINNWTLDMSKTFSGPTTDLITLEGFIAVGPDTSPGDLGGFVKAFQGNSTTGDLATLHMTQDTVGLAGQKYVLTGWIGAGVNYSGLLAGPTKTELAIEFDNDNNRGNGVLGSAITDVKAAGLTSGGCCAFGAQQFMAMGTAPAGTTVARARFSAIDMYATQNPDQAAFIDDFSLDLIPEPASAVLGLIAAVGMLGLLRRR